MIHKALLVLALTIPVFLSGQTSLMTHNIRYNNPKDQENWWENRKSDVADMMNYYSPDIIGIQEGLYSQVNYLDSALVDHDYVGVGRDDGVKAGEFSAIFYNTERMRAISSKTYWLSETPNQVSVGWDASMERITTFAEFENLVSGDTIYVFNCHFDHKGPVSRENAAKLVVEFIQKKGLMDKKVIVMGDLNSEPQEAPIEAFKSVLEDSYEVSAVKPYGAIGTWCSFDTDKIPSRRIDYILTKNVKVAKYENVGDRRPNNLRLSDHLPVLISIDQ